MKRIRIIGVVLVAALAFSVLVASAAQAGEFGHCVKAVPKNTGTYTDKNCQKLAVPAGTGKYNWVPVPLGSHIPYTSKTKTAILETPGVGNVVCKKSTDVGAITGPFEDEDIVTFTSCETLGKKCTSAGQPAGTIKTFLLDTFLIDLENGEVLTVYLSSEPGHEPYLAEFNCEGVLIRVKGHVAAVEGCDINVMSTKDCETFAVGKGEQDLETEISVDGGVTYLGPFPSNQIAEGSSKSEKLEIKT